MSRNAGSAGRELRFRCARSVATASTQSLAFDGKWKMTRKPTIIDGPPPRLHVLWDKVVRDEQAFAASLKERMVGQDAVLDRLARQLRRGVIAARKDSPIAVMLAVGPAGVGKTMLAGVLADALCGNCKHLHHISFGEIGRSPQAMARITGEPKPYLGGEGMLTAALREVPSAVVLFDEIQHADPHMLQQCLEEARSGAIIDRHTGQPSSTADAIFLLTSNMLSREIGDLCAGHTGTPDELEHKARNVLSAGVRGILPDALTCIDEVLVLRTLRGADIASVCALQIEMLAQSYDLEITEGGIDKAILLDAVEHHERSGCKGGVRDITRRIESVVADDLVEAKAAGATRVSFQLADGQIRAVPAGTIQ